MAGEVSVQAPPAWGGISSQPAVWDASRSCCQGSCSAGIPGCCRSWGAALSPPSRSQCADRASWRDPPSCRNSWRSQHWGEALGMGSHFPLTPSGQQEGSALLPIEAGFWGAQWVLGWVPCIPAGILEQLPPCCVHPAGVWSFLLLEGEDGDQ